MAELKPFKALRPVQMFAKQISSRPYDVVTSEEAKELIKENEISFLRVTRSDVVCENSTPYSAKVYHEASDFLTRLKKEECFIKEKEENFFIYQLRYEDHIQTGIAATFSVQEYENNKILKHEYTRIEKEEDRTNHIITTKAQTGPAYLMFKNRALIESAMQTVKDETKPLFNFTDDELVNHTIWKVPTEINEVLIDEFSKLDHLYIVDGHHRSASAANVKHQLQLEGDHPGSYFLGVAFPDNQLVLGACNRLILDTDISPMEFITRLTENFYVNIIEKPTGKGINLYFDKNWYQLKPSTYLGNQPVEHLDTYIVQQLIFKPVLGIEDPRTSDKLDYIRSSKGTKILEDKVNSGEAFAAITVEPVSIETVIKIAESGDVMPPKSTWFFPKMRDGLLIHEID